MDKELCFGVDVSKKTLDLAYYDGETIDWKNGDDSAVSVPCYRCNRYQGLDQSTVVIPEAIAGYKDQVKFISELDYGMYEAVNKDLRMATGDVISLCHCILPAISSVR